MKKTGRDEHKIKEKYLLKKPQAPMILDCCLLLTQTDKHLIKTVEKLFELQNVSIFHPLKCAIKIPQYSVLKLHCSEMYCLFQMNQCHFHTKTSKPWLSNFWSASSESGSSDKDLLSWNGNKKSTRFASFHILAFYLL